MISSTMLQRKIVKCDGDHILPDKETFCLMLLTSICLRRQTFDLSGRGGTPKIRHRDRATMAAQIIW
jgi:hypothetical protein